MLSCRFAEPEAVARTELEQSAGDGFLLPGPFAVRLFRYGSGTDKTRCNYRDQVEILTDSADIVNLVPHIPPAEARYRACYWGFALDHAPINGLVCMPVGPGPFPLVLFVHGNAPMRRPSEDGYVYLQQHLASRGFATASIDENFLNMPSVWHRPDWDEMPARAWLVIEHLRTIAAWNDDPRIALCGKLDLGNVALVGHSRGGEAVALATNWCQTWTHSPLPGMSIRAVVAITPTDQKHVPEDGPIPLTRVSYFLLQGSHNTDVPLPVGIRQYQRANVAADAANFKCAVYIHRANHSRFNSEWGNADLPAPFGWFLTPKPLMPAQRQRQIALASITAFLEAAIRSDSKGRDWLLRLAICNDCPFDAMHVVRYEDASRITVANFDERHDTIKGQRCETIVCNGPASWHKAELTFRDRRRTPHENGVAVVRWSGHASASTASIALGVSHTDARFQFLDADSAFTFSVAPLTDSLIAGDPPTCNRPSAIPHCHGQDWSIELTDDAGSMARRAFSEFGRLPPTFDVRLTRHGAGWLERRLWPTSHECMLQSIRAPMAAFIAANPRFRPERLAEIRFSFDRTPSGAIVLDDVGLELASTRPPQ